MEAKISVALGYMKAWSADQRGAPGLGHPHTLWAQRERLPPILLSRGLRGHPFSLVNRCSGARDAAVAARA